MDSVTLHSGGRKPASRGIERYVAPCTAQRLVAPWDNTVVKNELMKRKVSLKLKAETESVGHARLSYSAAPASCRVGSGQGCHSP